MKKQKQNPALNKQKGKFNAYYASKSELLTWANTLLDLELRSIEETRTGAVFCQLLDATYPGTVRLNKVNWKANTETEYQSNFKIFQQGLISNNIEKTIDITRLSKGKLQELVELFQWLYGLHHSLGIDCSSYNALKIRNGQNLILKKNMGKIFDDNISQGSSTIVSMDHIRKRSNNLQCGNFSKKKINQLNANLRGNNFYTKFNNEEKLQSSKNNSKKDKSFKWRHNHDININNINNKSHQQISSSKKSIDNSQIYSCSSNKNISFISNFDNNINNYSLNEFSNFNHKQDNSNIFNNISDLDVNLFEGINEVEKNNIMSLEQKDGNDPLGLKIIIRKLRIENVKLKNDMKYILKEKDYFLNKLKDIDYLYFNNQIKNDEQSKSQILKTIITSHTDTTINLDPNGIAFITGQENTLPNNKINFNQIENNNGINLNQNKMDNLRSLNREINDQKKFPQTKKLEIKISGKTLNNNIKNFSKCSVNEFESNISKRSQPPMTNNLIYLSEVNKQLQNNNENFNSNLIISPSHIKKNYNYDISKEILNDSLHIANEENMN